MTHAAPPAVSIAALLDDIRPLIARERAAGKHPRYLMLPGAEYDAVRALKASDAARGLPVMVLGLEIVRSDDPGAAPKVF
jgi:hypothetical protein